MKPIVALHHVKVDFPSKAGPVTILRDINLQISSRELITIIGESGCGKSTLGKVCLGTLRPTKGAVFYDSELIWDDAFRWTPALRLMVQVIHQDPFSSLNPVRTIYQTLSTPFRHYKMAGSEEEIRRRVCALLESVGLAPADAFIEKYPFQLSGGQKQRVSISRAMIMKPKLIIADEPVSGVDASSRLNILGLMKKLNEDSDIAFLYITHDLATAKYFAPNGRMLVMYLGRVVETGVVTQCIDRPAHPYLQALLSAIMSTREKRAVAVKGAELPSLLSPPPGCSFHPRCTFASEICSREEPELLATGHDPAHLVACHHAKEIPPLV